MRILTANETQFADFDAAIAPSVRDGFGAHFGQTPTMVMQNGLRLSSHAWAAYAKDEPIAMWGVSPVSLLSAIGQLWVVPTVNICKHPFAFARASRRMTNELLYSYKVLMCWVHRDEVIEMNWMRWLGFEFRENGSPLIYAVLER